jgi:hypothetical protein
MWLDEPPQISGFEKLKLGTRAPISGLREIGFLNASVSQVNPACAAENRAGFFSCTSPWRREEQQSSRGSKAYALCCFPFSSRRRGRRPKWQNEFEFHE